MPVYNCKMCGAPLGISTGMTVCGCTFCGTAQTLPKIGDEKYIAAANRANHFRQSGDFDRAEQAYADVIAQEKEEAFSIGADIYWSLTLCRYGIEYVTDPATQKMVPTCHRLQYKDILDDDDYKRAISYADDDQKKVIESEANYISKVQKRILDISAKEEPYDVFICYKESDEQGARTKDSVLAQDMYYELVREGYKVFFSRVTLEGKLGTEYEPFIFAALHSAKTMIVIGTKKEYFVAPWVKNEWMRYLAIMKEDRNRRLIPAYLGMDPYDLPDALATFQAQDMSKLGFMQDILTNIGRATQEEYEKNAAIRETLVVPEVSETAPLLRRIGYFLEDGEFDRAEQYVDRVLNLDPECAQAYFYKAMCDRTIRSQEELEQLRDPAGISAEPGYQKALRFASPEMQEDLKRIDHQIIYNDAVYKMQQQDNVDLFIQAIPEFRSIPGFRDVDEKLQECIALKKSLLEEHYLEIGREYVRLIKQDTTKYPGPLRELALRYDSLAKMLPEKELTEPEKNLVLDLCRTCEDRAKECRYFAAVAELDRAVLPEDKRAAANQLLKMGSYRDAHAKAENCLRELKQKDLWRLNGAQRSADLIASSHRQEKKGFWRRLGEFILALLDSDDY